MSSRTAITRYTEVGRSGGGGARIILPGETEAAMGGRNHAQEKSGGLFEAMKGARWLHFYDPLETTSDQ
jgi:hypothetical protein